MQKIEADKVTFGTYYQAFTVGGPGDSRKNTYLPTDRDFAND